MFRRSRKLIETFFFLLWQRLVFYFYKVWLSLTHFPIEDSDTLKRLRSLLSPFLKNVQRCFDGVVLAQDEKNQLCNDILKTLSSDIEPELVFSINQYVNRPENRTLVREQNALEQMSIR